MHPSPLDIIRKKNVHTTCVLRDVHINILCAKCIGSGNQANVRNRRSFENDLQIIHLALGPLEYFDDVYTVRRTFLYQRTEQEFVQLSHQETYRIIFFLRSPKKSSSNPLSRIPFLTPHAPPEKP